MTEIIVKYFIITSLTNSSLTNPWNKLPTWNRAMLSKHKSFALKIQLPIEILNVLHHVFVKNVHMIWDLRPITAHLLI